MDNVLNNISQNSSFSFADIIFSLAVTLVLVLIISWVYRKTHQGFSYSQSFNFTLIIIGLLISLVMMVIGSNLAIAFGALGAFSLIRFRTAVKDTKDTAFVFFAVAVGMAAGTANYLIAILGTVVITAVILALNKMNFGSLKKFNYILSLSFQSVLTPGDQMRELFKKYLKSDSLLYATARDHGKVLDMTFYINLVGKEKAQEFISELENINGISSVSLITAKDDVEY